jgi:hypothetical protein
MGVEALCSFTPNVGVAAPSQPLVVFDLVFGDAPLRVRRRKTKFARLSSVFEPRSNRGCICRANSFEESDNQPVDEVLENRSSTKVSVRFGPSSQPQSQLDGFRRQASLDFEDEFFARMMELEASHRHVRGTCPTTFFETPTQERTPHHGGNEALGCLGGVQLPSSIKKLRRQNREQHPRGCAIRNAFSSMVFMIKALQSHALQIRQVLFSEWDVQEVLPLVHREMHSSFVWLFQQVFAATPKLMVSVMLLLANFTVYSMSENVAVATETPAPIAHFLETYGPNPQAALNPHFKRTSPSPRHSGVSSGGMNKPPSSPSVANGCDGNGGALNSNAPLQAAKEDYDATKMQQFEMMKAWVKCSMEELKRGAVLHQQLEQETIRRLVAPVVAHLESDNYACFDRTDLEYQLAISKDGTNPLLLANYAQFLYVVRHDHDRAEGYFHRAMQVDPLDSVILGRFASFLWLGRGNRAAAERAYKAAMAADPDSSFPASNYAHFLWHSGDPHHSHLEDS